MDAEFTSTPEDYREANAVHTQLFVPPLGRTFIMGSYSVIVAFVLLVLAVDVLQQPVPTTGRRGEIVIVEMSLLLVFLPPALPALWITCHLAMKHLLLTAARRRWSLEASPPQASIRTYKPKAIRLSEPRSPRHFIAAALIAVVTVSTWIVFVTYVGNPHLRPTGSTPARANIWLHPFVLLSFNASLWAGVGLFWLSFQHRLYGRVLVRMWEKQPALWLPKSFRADDSGCTLSDRDATLIYQWSAITKFVEAETLFLLYISDHLFHMIPKRALRSEEEMIAFLQLLSRSVQNGFLLEVRGRAFPVLPIVALRSPDHPNGP
jgi:hypothetical protein